ncbi:hypothetical protein Tco_1046439, partial [Tanacetum coccineum]
GSSAHEGTGVTPGVPDVPEYGSDDEQLSWKSSDEEDEDDEANVGKDEDNDDHDDDDERTESDNDGEDFVHPKFLTHDDEARQEEVNEEDSFDPRVQTPSHVESTDDDEIQGTNVAGEEMDEEETNAEGKENELYRDINVNLEGRDAEMTNAQQTNVQTTQVLEDTHVIITPVNPEGQQQSSSVSSGFVSNMLNPRPDTGIDSIFTLNTKATSLVNVPVTTIAEPPLVSATTLPPPPTPLITHMQQTPVPTPTTVPSTSLQDLPNFGSLFGFDYRLKTLETDFYEFKQTNQFAEAVSSIPGIVDVYLANKMKEAVKIAVQLQSNRLIDEAQAENEDFLNKLDDNIKKIIKNQVKEQVKTSLAIAANLSKLELKKILIEKIKSNKSIYRSNEQNNLYKALLEAYESDKLILDTYGDTVSFKRRRDNEDKDKEPSTRSNRGNLTQEEGPRESFDELMDTPLDFSAFMMNQLKIETLTPELLASPTFELMKGTCKSLVELEYFFEEVYKATMDQLDWHNPKGQQYPHDLRKPLPLIPNSHGHQVIPFDHFINNDLAYLSSGVLSHTYETSVTKTKAADYESARDVYSKCRIIVVTKLQIVEWHGYKHLDCITIRRDDEKLYTFKEGDFKRLRLQDIEDMLILLVQGELTNLNVEDRLAFGVSLRMFTRSIVIQRHVEDL